MQEGQQWVTVRLGVHRRSVSGATPFRDRRKESAAATGANQF
jgi:hypothetical protein